MNKNLGNAKTGLLTPRRFAFSRTSEGALAFWRVRVLWRFDTQAAALRELEEVTESPAKSLAEPARGGAVRRAVTVAIRHLHARLAGAVDAESGPLTGLRQARLGVLAHWGDFVIGPA